MRSCYMCEDPAESSEHVPPKCFFPERKDLGSYRDYRQNLITVPSCKRHNLSKSKDDEYLLFVVVGHWENNEVAQRLFSTKILRAIRGRPRKRQVYLRQWIRARVGSMTTGAPVVDRGRFDESMACVARGLHFHHFDGEQWTADIWVETGALVLVGGIDFEQRSARLQALELLSAKYLKNKPWLGDNPAVFCYQIYRDEDTTHLLVRMRFYQGFTVLAAPAM